MILRPFFRNAALIVTALLSAAAAFAGPAALRTAVARDGREAYIVVFRDAPLARSIPREALGTLSPSADFEAKTAALRSRQDEFARDMQSRIEGFQPGARYVRVLNGMAVLVPGGSLARLRNDPRVRAVFPVRKYALHLDASNPLMGAPVFWSALGGDGEAGKGVKVADLDTGVDFSNPMFTDPSLPMPDGFPRENDGDHFANSKVIVAKYFQGIIDFSDPLLSTSQRTAQDLSGHGSHTASVAAGAKVTLSGSGRRPVTLEGVAPKAYLGDYKVFSPGAYSDNIIAAIEAAAADGMNVLNMSFGLSNSDGTEPFLYSAAAENEAIQNAIAAGVVITVSAGNGGEDADGNPNANPDSISSTADVPEVIAVGASTNSHDGVTAANLAEVSMTSGKTPPPGNLTNLIGSAGSNGAAIPDPAISARFNDWDVLDSTGDGTACSSLSGTSVLSGQIVLIQRGTCTFSLKIQHAQAAGAIGVVLYNKASGSDGGDALILYDTSGTVIPSVFLRRSDGLSLKAYIDANAGNPPSAQGTLGPVPPGTPAAVFATTSHELAPFSGIGPTLDLQIKPDLTSVGTGSYAAVQDDDPKGDGRFGDDETDPSPFFDPSGFAFGQGTSFSAPRVAGSAALLKQKHSSWTPAEIKAALMETAARPTDASDASKVGNFSVLQRGSGEVDLAAASTVGSIVLPSSYSYRRVAFNALPAGNALDRIFRLENKTAAPVTYTITAVASPAFSDPALTPSVNPSTLTLSPGESGAFTLSLALGAALIHGQHDSEGAILVSDGGASIPGALYVPYWVRVAFPAGHGPTLTSATSTFTAAQNRFDVAIDATDADADLSTFSLEFFDASGTDLGGGIGSLADFGIDTSQPSVSGDIVLTHFTTSVGCASCASVAVAVTDAMGNVSNTLFSRFGSGVDAQPVPAASDAVYQRSLPLVAHAQGAQFVFQSDVRLLNPDPAHILTLDAYLGPQGQPGYSALHVAHQLLPRESFPLDDLVASDFKLTTGIGSLVLVSSDGHPFLASSRVYDHNAAGGTFGTFAGSITPSEGVGASDGTVSANGFPTATGFHTNVGATEVSGVSSTVKFEGFDESGASVGSFTQTIQPYSNFQTNPLADAAHAFSAPAARVSFTLLSGGKILPYASTVDEGSGDSLLSIAAKQAASGDDAFITGAGRVHGALGTFATSDLSITNASDGPRTVELSLLPVGGLPAPPTPPAPLTLSAGQTAVFPDVLQSAFGFTGDAVAGIRVHPQTPANLVVSARTSTPNQGGSGAYGFFVNGAKASAALVSGGKRVSIHLEHDSRFRTNFGFTEIAGAPVVVRATFFDENGIPLGTRVYAVAAHRFVQVSAADLLGAATSGNGYVEFTIDSGSGNVLAFATVVDNITADSIYVPAESE